VHEAYLGTLAPWILGLLAYLNQVDLYIPRNIHIRTVSNPKAEILGNSRFLSTLDSAGHDREHCDTTAALCVTTTKFRQLDASG